MGLPRLDKRRFRLKTARLKIAKFSHPVYFAPPLIEGIPLEFGRPTGAEGQKLDRMMYMLKYWADRERSLLISSAHVDVVGTNFGVGYVGEARPEGPRAGMGFLGFGKGAASPSPQIGGLRPEAL